MDSVRYLRDGDIEHVAANMRQADIEEITAGTGSSPADALIESVMLSTACLALDIDGEPAAIFGVAPLTGMLGSMGSPWLLGTRLLERRPRALIALGPYYRDGMLAMYPHLVNYVDARNTRSIRWLKWLGFEFDEAKPHGAAGLPFHRFELRR